MRFGSGDFAEDADKEIQRDMGDNFADFAVIESSSVSSGSHPILTGAAVMVFRHASHGRVNLVYRRPDGNVGWMDPPSPSH